MELTYKYVFYIGIVVVVFLLFSIFFKVKKKNKYKDGVKIANTKYAKSIPYYKEILLKYKVLSISILSVCLVCIGISFILLSRPAKVDTNETKSYSRDIFLCMDVSTSVDELNLQIIDNLKDIVKDLKGERVGINIFNTSSVQIVPLTDDYDYVLEVLDELEKSIKAADDILNSSNYDYEYRFSGTLVGNETRGSSLIGDGLASSVLCFPNLEEDKERTRIIIFSTDNDLRGQEIIPLKQAAALAKKKNVKVFGICPKEALDKDKTEMKSAIESSRWNFL